MPGPPRVPVYYFPKKAAEAPGTLPETQLVDLPTEAISMVNESPIRIEPAPERPGKRPKKERPATKEERAALKRSLTPVAVDTVPALGYHLEKLQQMMNSPDPVKLLRGMGKRQLLEMSLFGHQLFQVGRMDEARVMFEGIVGLGVADAFPHTMLGTIYLALGRMERAHQLFEAALAIDPDDVAARVYRGELRLNGGKVKAATEDLLHAVKAGARTDPFVERAHRLLGIAERLKPRKKSKG